MRPLTKAPKALTGCILALRYRVTQDQLNQLAAGVRDVPDFPKPGILFKDINPILGDPKLLPIAVEALIEPVRGQKIDKVVGVDARGFIFAAPAALQLNAGMVLVRKKGKLPWQTHSLAYSLEYGEAEVEIHTDAILPGENVLLIDDLLATGGTAAAAQRLIEKIGGNLIATAFLIELEFLEGRQKLAQTGETHSILKY